MGYLDNITDVQILIDNTPLQGYYIPEKILFRDKEIEKIANTVFMKPLRRTPQAPMPMFVYGDPSTGKTLVVQRLMKELIEKKLDHVRVYYINCGNFSALPDFGVHLSSLLKVQAPKGHGATEYVKKFLKKIDGKYKYVIIILDEIEKLAPKNFHIVDNVIYTFVRAATPEVRLLKESKIGVVLISNNKEFKDKLSRGTRSSFGVNRVDFDRYTNEQVREIIEDRCEQALTPGSWGKKMIDTLIKEVYEPIGLREAFSTIEVAATYAEGKEKKKIGDEELKEAIALTKREAGETFINKYDLTHKLIMLLSFTNEYLFFKDLLSGYNRICKLNKIDNKGDQTLRKVIQHLERDGLFKFDFQDKGSKRYRASMILLDHKETVLEIVQKELGKEMKITGDEKDLRAKIYSELLDLAGGQATINSFGRRV